MSQLLSFVVIFISITTVSAGQRSANAWPKDFNVTRLPTWPIMKKYFATVPKRESEDHTSVRIQRRFTGIRFKNGTEWFDKGVLFAPIVIFIVDPKRYVRMLSIAYTVITVLATGAAVFYTARSMFKLAAPVYVKNLYDTNKPSREMPVSVTLQLRGKKLGKTKIETEPRTSRVDLKKGSKNEKKEAAKKEKTVSKK